MRKNDRNSYIYNLLTNYTIQTPKMAINKLKGHIFKICTKKHTNKRLFLSLSFYMIPLIFVIEVIEENIKKTLGDFKREFT